MIGIEELRKKIQNGCETKNLDYKEGFNWNSKKAEKLKLIKDILSMANTKDGGEIIIGVRDSNYMFTGLLDDDYASFDQTKVNELLEGYAEPIHVCHVVKKEVDGKKVVCIRVPEFSDFPVICKREYKDLQGKMILEKAAIYARTGKATSEKICSVTEMSNLINMVIERRNNEIESERAEAEKETGQELKRSEAISNDSITGVRLAENVYAGVTCKKCKTSVGMLIGSDKCPTCGAKIGS